MYTLNQSGELKLAEFIKNNHKDAAKILRDEGLMSDLISELEADYNKVAMEDMLKYDAICHPYCARVITWIESKSGETEELQFNASDFSGALDADIIEHVKKSSQTLIWLDGEINV